MAYDYEIRIHPNDEAFHFYNKVKWNELDTTQAIGAAYMIMHMWKFQNKVPEYTKIVMDMDSVEKIQMFMYRSLVSGARFFKANKIPAKPITQKMEDKFDASMAEIYNW